MSDDTIPKGLLTEISNRISNEIGKRNPKSFSVEEMSVMVTTYSKSKSWRTGRVRKGESFWIKESRVTDNGKNGKIYFRFQIIGGGNYDFIELSLEKAREVFHDQLDDFLVEILGMSVENYALKCIDDEKTRIAEMERRAYAEMEGWGTF